MKEIVEKGLGHLIITSSSFHFFKKTDFEQYLFNPRSYDCVRNKGRSCLACEHVHKIISHFWIHAMQIMKPINAFSQSNCNEITALVYSLRAPPIYGPLEILYSAAAV